MPLNGNLKAPCKGVTSWVIRTLYKAFILNIIIKGKEFIHDKVSPYRGLIMRDILREMEV